MDKRIIPARKDLAAESFRKNIKAERYATGTPFSVIQNGAPLRFLPDHSANLESQLIYGEVFQVFEERDGWCWGQNLCDDYVGYVPAACLGINIPAPDHEVVTLHSHLYTEPNLQRPAAGLISMSAKVKIIDTIDNFRRIYSGHWLYSGNLLPIGSCIRNPVDVARQFIGAPYLWGGRTPLGLDCSSLVQISLAMANISAPRDSDLQEAILGTPVRMDSPQDFSRIQEGDLVFFPGHVGIYISDWRFLHANAFDMQVSLHGFSSVLERANTNNACATSIRRLESIYVSK